MPVGRDGIVAAPSLLLVGVILIGIAAFLIYRAPVGTGSSLLIGIVVAAQLITIVWLSTRGMTGGYRTLLAAGAFAGVAAFVLISGSPTRSVGLAVAGICHAAAYSGLLIWFTGSLRPNCEPAVTGFARQMRRTMPVEVIRYTRRVTIAWCIFFAAQLTISAVLLAGAPRATWASFVSLLNLPLIVAMILAEFGCRLVLFRHEQRTGLIATLAGLRHIRGLPSKPLEVCAQKNPEKACAAWTADDPFVGQAAKVCLGSRS
jgi:uncharacterized membrane protein